MLQTNHKGNNHWFFFISKKKIEVVLKKCCVRKQIFSLNLYPGKFFFLSKSVLFLFTLELYKPCFKYWTQTCSWYRFVCIDDPYLRFWYVNTFIDLNMVQCI